MEKPVRGFHILHNPSSCNLLNTFAVPTYNWATRARKTAPAEKVSPLADAVHAPVPPTQPETRDDIEINKVQSTL